MSVTASATDASEKSGGGDGGFATNGLGIETFVFGDFELTFIDDSVFDGEIEAG